MSADEEASKLARYEALFQLSSKINILADIHQIGAAFASGAKYVADVYSWRYLAIEEQDDSTAQTDGALLIIDGYRGKATVSYAAPNSVSAFEQNLWQTQKPVFLEGDELVEVQKVLPRQFQDTAISQIYVHPQFGNDRLQGVFLCSTREKPFDKLDLKFVTLASILFHGKVRQVRIEHRLFDELEKKLEALRRVRQMENQLRVQEKMASVGSLVAGVAHEINTPLGAIKSSQDTLARAVGKLKEEVETTFSRGDGENGRFRSMVSVMESAYQAATAGTERINKIVQSLISFVHLDAAEFEMADLREGIESVLKLLQVQMGERITVVRDFADVSPLYCSPGRLNQVFMNLIQNSIKAIDDRGVIEIKIFQDDGDVHLHIRDTGAGMPPETLQRIFDFRFSNTGSRTQMKFGLSLDYKIIEQHGGSMKVESEEGEGTQVTICLPRVKPGASDVQNQQP
jgi:signal transduction histidine kinase